MTFFLNRRLYETGGGANDDAGGGTSLLTDPPDTPDGGDENKATPEAPVYEETDWRHGLSDEHKLAETIKDLKTPDDMVKKLIHAEAKIGADKITRPGKDASPEQMDEYFTALGRPEKASDYKLPEENMPEGIELDQDAVRVAHEAFHKLGISQQQGAELIRLQAELVDGQQKKLLEADQAAQKQAAEDLRKDEEFGGAAFDQNIALAQAAVEKLGGDDLKKVLDETGLGNLPPLIKAFAKMGRMMGDDAILGKGPRADFIPSKVEAKTQIDELYADKDWSAAYHSEEHPAHDAAVEKMRKLSKIAFPDEA